MAVAADEPNLEALQKRLGTHRNVMGALAKDSKVQMAMIYLAFLLSFVALVAFYISGLSLPARGDADKHISLADLAHFVIYMIPLSAMLACGFMCVFRDRSAWAVLKGMNCVNGLVEKSCFFIDMFCPNNRVSNALSKMPRAAQKQYYAAPSS